MKDTQPLSKDLLKVLIKNFFIDEREGPEYSKAVLYHTVFNFVPYKGIGEHAISTGKKGATFILVWKDKIRLDSEANIESAISQAALEVKGEIPRLEKSLNIFRIEYCGILTNGTEFILVSGYHVMAELKWRHSNTVSIAGEGTSHIKDEEIAKVVLLLAYAFTCANKVFDLIRNAPVPGPQHPPIEEADRDDQVEEIRVLFDSTNLNERPNRSGSSGVRSHGGNLKGGRGTNKTGTSSRADSGKNNCFRDFNTYQILTSERKQLHDKENVPFNSLSKAASTRLFF